MKQLNIDPILSRFYDTVQSHRIQPGVYSRTSDGLPNAYGCADAANILYTLNRFPADGEERTAHCSAIRSFQDPERGIFLEPTHSDIHTTAHCTAALELFDARPLYPFYELDKYKTPKNLEGIFEAVDWLHCGRAAHNGAGIYAAFVITGAVGPDWTNHYFDFLDRAMLRGYREYRQIIKRVKTEAILARVRRARVEGKKMKLIFFLLRHESYRLLWLLRKLKPRR